MNVMHVILAVLVPVVAACGNHAQSASTVKSEYPSDFSTLGSCQSQGPVSICRALQPFYGLAVVDLEYSGTVLDLKSISAFVKVTYQDGPRQGTFAALPDFPLNRAHVRVTGGCLVGELGGCAQAGTPEMRDLLQWAAQASNSLNALDIEVAFVDGAGNWDSNLNANYKFHFDAASGQ